MPNRHVGQDRRDPKLGNSATIKRLHRCTALCTWNLLNRCTGHEQCIFYMYGLGEAPSLPWSLEHFLLGASRAKEATSEIIGLSWHLVPVQACGFKFVALTSDFWGSGTVCDYVCRSLHVKYASPCSDCNCLRVLFAVTEQSSAISAV